MERQGAGTVKVLLYITRLASRYAALLRCLPTSCLIMIFSIVTVPLLIVSLPLTMVKPGAELNPQPYPPSKIIATERFKLNRWLSFRSSHNRLACVTCLTCTIVKADGVSVDNRVLKMIDYRKIGNVSSSLNKRRQRQMITMRFLLMLAIVALISSPVGAGTISWNNTGSGLWSTPDNWSPVNVPLPGDDVVENNTGAGTITVASDTTIKSLTSGGAHKIVLSTGKITVSAAVSLKVFVTSSRNHGNLSAWPDAGGSTGLEAGDAICQAAASSAGLPGTYKAWLSTNATDAYCHIQGFSGKITANCGQGVLPVTAGPWVRTDGHFFSGRIDELINNGNIYTPVEYDETGTSVSNGSYYSGTNSAGAVTASGEHCVNWTSNSGSNYSRFGYTEGTTGMWTDYGGASCDASLRLLCFQSGSGGSLPGLTAPTGSKKVFVTSTTHKGNLGGLTGADQKCQTRATAGGLANPSKFKAWLSDLTINAGDHITSDGPWYRPDGIKVASNKAALTASSSTHLFTAISQNETGAYTTNQYLLAWTGTGDNGVGIGDRCNDWGNGTAGYTGQIGYATLSDNNWTTVTSVNCNELHPLYCFEDE
jgi:hypothetical protein